MTCVICKDAVADNGYNSTKKYKVVTCMHCRRRNYPTFMSGQQYRRYWDAFNKKWEKENKNDMCSL